MLTLRYFLTFPLFAPQWIMHTRTLADANRWVAAIQDVIECSPPLTTKFEKCINLVSGYKCGLAQEKVALLRVAKPYGYFASIFVYTSSAKI